LTGFGSGGRRGRNRFFKRGRQLLVFQSVGSETATRENKKQRGQRHTLHRTSRGEVMETPLERGDNQPGNVIYLFSRWLPSMVRQLRIGQSLPIFLQQVLVVSSTATATVRTSLRHRCSGWDTDGSTLLQPHPPRPMTLSDFGAFARLTTRHPCAE
jgi:hypothetical protein